MDEYNNEKIMQNINVNNNLTRTSSTSPTRKFPKKGILKNVNSNNRRSIATSNASDLIYMNTSPPLSPKSAAAANAEHNKRMHWDEMNILATYHPPDKDYGFMKCDEPPTPYNKVDSMSDDEFETANGIDASKLENELNLNRKKLPKYMQEQMNLSDNEESDDNKRNPEFEAHRKAHYNEFKMAQILKSQLDDDDEDDDSNKT